MFTESEFKIMMKVQFSKYFYKIAYMHCLQHITVICIFMFVCMRIVPIKTRMYKTPCIVLQDHDFLMKY